VTPARPGAGDWRRAALDAIDRARDAVGVPADDLRHRVLELLDAARSELLDDLGVAL
jgi:hypothetical protein